MSDTTDWALIAQKLHQDCRALESKLAEVTKHRDEWFEVYTKTLKRFRDAENTLVDVIKQRDAFRHELSKVMPPDYKDWWENDKNEWPIVARLTIESKRRLIDMDRETIERLERELAEVTKLRDELGDALQRFVNRLQYNSVFMDGKMTCARVNRNPIKEWDEDCIFAFEVLEKLKGGER